MEITVRRAEAADAPAIAAILRELGWFPHINGEPQPVTEDRIRRHLDWCRAHGSHVVYTALADGREVIGFVSVHWLPYLLMQGSEGYVSELFVKASHRGMGAGRKLIAAVVEEAEERGCARLMLLNRRSRESYRRGFYPKSGWEEREDMVNFIYPIGRRSGSR